MFSEANELVVPISRLKMAGIVLGAAGFVLIGGWLLVDPAKEDFVHTIVGAVSVGFFGLVGVSALRRLLTPGPAVVINSEGIVDQASAFAVGPVRWDEIEVLRQYNFHGQTFLAIVPKDLGHFLAQRSIWIRAAVGLNLAFGAEPINIPQASLPVTVSDLLQETKRRFTVPVDMGRRRRRRA